MLDFDNEENSSSSDNDIIENVLLILSDEWNIFSEGEQKVPTNAIKYYSASSSFKSV